MDIVGCSKLPSDDQKRIVGRLQEMVRESSEFRRSRANDQVISLPTGDGMALAFLTKLDAAAQCAIEITKAIQAESLCKIRMGVHTGSVFVMEDINDARNISGAGINRAERVMSCGGDGHILLSDTAAESLRHLSEWRDKIHEVGECQIKDGWIRVWNLVDGPIGNPELPKKSRKYIRRRRLMLETGLTALALLLVAAVAGAFLLGRVTHSAMPGVDEPSIAVMPFEDKSLEKNQAYFSDGLADELRNGLAKIKGLRVAGSTSSVQVSNQPLEFRTIGEKLNVATILEGNVRKQGNRWRISVSLIKAADGFHLWSEIYDQDLTDIFAVQEQIARAVTRELKVKLLGGNATSPPKQNTNAEAYNAYLQGKYFMGRGSKETLEKAVDYFEQAIKLDARYAPAWVGLGEARSHQAGWAYLPVEDGYRKARAAVDRALEFDPTLGEAYFAMGNIQEFHEWDWAGADASFKRAEDLEPGSPKVKQGAGGLARILGRWDDALALYRRAIEIDPLDPRAYFGRGIVLYYAGQNQNATTALKKALELAPEMSLVHAYLGQVYLATSQAQRALAEMEQEKDPAFRLCGMAVAYRALGQEKESGANLAELISKFQAANPYQIAEVLAFRGDTDQAFEWLRKAYTARDTGLPELKGDALMKNLSKDPRYTEFLVKMQLPR